MRPPVLPPRPLLRMPTSPSAARLNDHLARLESLLEDGDGATLLLVGDDDACGEALTAVTRLRANDVHRVDLTAVADDRPHVAQGVLREKFDSAAETNATLFFEHADALFAAARREGAAPDAFTRLDYLFQRAEAYAGLVVLCLRDRAHVPADRTFDAVVEL